VSRATPELVAAADLIIVGGPTHMHGMSTASSRRRAAETARKPGSALAMDPDADGPGLRSWLERLGARDVPAASFDTRLSGVPVLTGRASRGIARLLTSRGWRLLLAPESFLVSKQNMLVEGETERACSWGALVGETAHAAYVTGWRLRTRERLESCFGRTRTQPRLLRWRTSGSPTRRFRPGLAAASRARS
jgi:hypothetical protein